MKTIVDQGVDVRAGDDDVQQLQHVVVIIQPTIDKDIHLRTGEQDDSLEFIGFDQECDLS